MGNLRYLPEYGASNGMFTGETDAEVESWNAEIAELPDSESSDRRLYEAAVDLLEALHQSSIFRVNFSVFAIDTDPEMFTLCQR